MPRGKKNLKGRAKKFTSIEELESQRREEQNWRSKDNESSEEDSSSEDEKPEIIQTNNPNRVVQKEKKLSQLDDITSTGTAELSRREREEIQKQEAARRYQQLHAQGKTDEARADLARLAIVRKQREEAARKREEEKKEREARQNAAKEASLNAIKNKGGGGGRKRRK